jgi:predicted ATPase
MSRVIPLLPPLAGAILVTGIVFVAASNGAPNRVYFSALSFIAFLGLYVLWGRRHA